jgi:puromycin-sensitive aminopeptidase
VAEAFEKEPNFTAWSDLSSSLSSLSLIIQYTDFHDVFKAYLRKLFGPVTQRLGWDPKEGEGHLDAMLRSLVIGRMGRSGDQATIEEARKRFAAHCDGSQVMVADLRNPVCNPLRTCFLHLFLVVPGVYYCA